MYYLQAISGNYAFYTLEEAEELSKLENGYWAILTSRGDIIKTSENQIKMFYIENPMTDASKIEDKYYDDYNDAVNAMRSHTDLSMCVFRTSDNVILACKKF